MKNLQIFILFGLTLISCDRDQKTLFITDFSEKKEVELEPYEYKPYAMLKIRVKGFTNDTIRINYNLYGNSNFYISGNIDTLLVQTDYYGEGPVKLIFDPYKATEGEIEIHFKL